MTNPYMGIYAALEERGLPLAFHAAYNWNDQMLSQANRFITVHALGFTCFNIIHLTNWIINGIPERFPKLRTIWVESGLACTLRDAAVGQRVHDAFVRGAVTEAPAERIH
jgi:uncharacterized protein